MAKKKTEIEYSAKNITSLRPEEHLVKRLNLTFSDERADDTHPYSSQKTVACREIQDNSIGEVSRGFADRIRTVFYQDGSVEIQDNGRGLPTDSAKNAFGESASGVILTMGTLQSGESLGDEGSSNTPNQNGLGGAAVNFLSKRFDVKVYRNKKVYSISFNRGTPGFWEKEADPNCKFTPIDDKTYLKVEKDTRDKETKKLFPTGTYIRFWLDDDIFAAPYPIDIEDMITRIRGTAFLLPNNTFEVINYKKQFEDGSYQHEVFNFAEGLPQLVKLNQAGNQITDINTFSTKKEYIQKNVTVRGANGKYLHKDKKRSLTVDFSFGYTDTYSSVSDSYVNTIRTPLGGVHNEAFESALADAFNKKVLTMKSIIKASDPKPTVEDYKEGLSYAISLYMTEPPYTNQIKEKLGGGRAIKNVLYKAFYSELDKFAQANKNQEFMRTIATKVANAAKIRQKEKEEKEIKREKAKITNVGTALPSKLVDCEITHSEFSELFIAEGDSAKSSLKSARIAKYQAILPIRGKIINVLKDTNVKKILNDETIQSIIKTIGGGVGKDFSMDKARYQRIFIATDADQDGGWISSLLLVFFYKFFPGLIEGGHLFKMNSPLFFVKVKNRKKPIYCFTQSEYDELVKELEYYDEKGNKKSKIQEVVRAKGLGEANPEDLRVTSMYPTTRNVTRITLNDVKEAEKWLEIAMGKEIEPRKRWIELNPLKDNDD